MSESSKQAKTFRVSDLMKPLYERFIRSATKRDCEHLKEIRKQQENHNG